MMLLLFRARVAVLATLCLLGPLLVHAASLDAPLRVAVLAFDDVSEEPGHGALGLGMQSMLTTDLASVPGLTLVERARLGDVQAELSRGRGATFDPSSVARMGKLLGASHIAVGSFAVVGKSMRLDARLVEVKSAKVVTTAHAEGEKDGFFEHEKTLVKGLVSALALDLPAKVRGELGRYHTTDYEAFERFSDGLARADLGKLEEARVALRQATRIDPRFSLAQRSLDELEQLARQVGKREELAKQAETADQKRALSGEALRIQGWLHSLEKLAPKHDTDGTLALYALSAVQREQPRALDPFWARIDRFAARRAGDVWARNYWQRARREGARFGWDPSVGFGMGSSLGEKDDLTLPGKPQWSYLRGRIATDAASALSFEKYPFDEQRAQSFGTRLVRAASAFGGGQVDTLHMAEELMRGILRSGKAGAPVRDQLLLAFADRFLFAGAYEDTARLLSELGGVAESSQILTGVRERLETLHALQSLLERHKDDAQAIRERFMAVGRDSLGVPAFGSSNIQFRLRTLERDLGERGRDALLCGLDGTLEAGSTERYVVVGKEPLWFLSGSGHVRTRGLLDPWTASALQYEHNDKPTAARADGDTPPWPYPSLLAAGMSARSQGGVRAHFQFVAPADFRTRSDARCRRVGGKPLVGKASAGLLLGLRDIFVGQDEDPKTGEFSTPAPTRGYGVRIRAGQLELFSLVESWRFVTTKERNQANADRAGSFGPKIRFEIQLLAQRALPDRPSYELTLEQRAGTLTATAGDVAISARIGDMQPGFAGVWFEDAGYASVQALQLTEGK
jgi:TolB-like protein